MINLASVENLQYLTIYSSRDMKIKNGMHDHISDNQNLAKKDGTVFGR